MARFRIPVHPLENTPSHQSSSGATTSPKSGSCSSVVLYIYICNDWSEAEKEDLSTFSPPPFGDET
jgi:hypothetical protein